MIRFFRSIKVIISFFIFGLGSAVLSFIIFPFIHIFIRKNEKRKWYSSTVQKSWDFFIKFALVNFGIIKLNVDKKALQNIKGKIIVANHPSFIDIVILIGLIPKSVCMAKKEVLKNPVFHNIVKSIYLVNDEDINMLKKDADDFIKDGYNIIIFPTGTRTTDNMNIKLHKGFASIAISSNTDIVPIKISCSDRFLAKGQIFCDGCKKIVTYDIKILDTISVNDFDEQDEIKLRNKIANKIKEILY